MDHHWHMEEQVSRKRGFLAEFQRQARLAEQRKRQAEQNAARAAREQQAAIRRHEQELRAVERATATAHRLNEQELKRLEREAKAAHQAARQADVDDLNAALAEKNAELDEILVSTLDVDDFVDLETLRAQAEHPPFAYNHLRTPTPRPAPIPDPPRPERAIPAEPVGLFGRRRQRDEAEAAVEEQYRLDMDRWQRDMDDLPRWHSNMEAAYREQEERREQALAAALEQYRRDCARRDEDAAARNRQVDDLIVGLGYGTPDAVNEYIGIVLANSVYPDDFQVEHEASFDPSGAELSLRVTIPGPDAAPAVKGYRYVKASNEISSTSLSQKDLKDRYAGIVNAVALRTLHEIFEADRRGVIKAISLELGTDTISPATGRAEYVPFIAVATEREVFAEIDLSAVVPAATLQHLNAAVSKNPFGLVPVSVGGVRKA